VLVYYDLFKCLNKTEQARWSEIESEKRDNTSKLSYFTPQSDVSSISLHFQRIFHYNRTRLQLSRHTSLRFPCFTQKDFYKQSLQNLNVFKLLYSKSDKLTLISSNF